MGDKDAKDQFSSTEAYINCLQGGIEEAEAADAGGNESSEDASHSVLPVQVSEDCVNRDTRQQEDRDRVGLSHGDEAEATECGFSGTRWQGPQNGLSHWVSTHRLHGRQNVTLTPNGRDTPIADEIFFVDYLHLLF